MFIGQSRASFEKTRYRIAVRDPYNGAWYYTPSKGSYRPVEIRTSDETISGYRGPRLLGVINPCTHSRVSVRPLSHIAYDERYANLIEGNVALSAGARTRAMEAYCNFSGSTKVTSAQMKALIALMQGDVPPIVSVPNMILELPQTLNLWKDLKDPLLSALRQHRKMSSRQKRMAARLSPEWRRRLREQGFPVRERLRHGANSLLAQQFGLLPLVGDLTTLLTSTKSIHSECQRLQKLPVDWERHKVALPASQYSANWFGTNTSSYGSFDLVDDQAQTSAYLTYRRKLARALPPQAQMATSLARALYGFNSPFSVLWEATPFSFVADWFYPIGDHIKSLESSDFEGLMHITNVCTCVRGESRIVVSHQYGSNRITPAAVLNGTSFRRWAGFPAVTPPWQDVSLPGIRQAVLGASLVLQRG